MSTTPIIRSTENCNYSLRYCAATSLQRDQVVTFEGGSRTQNMWPVPEAVVTVLCTPDDGCGWHPKHVHWTLRIINRLLWVASRWTIINMFVVFSFRSHSRIILLRDLYCCIECVQKYYTIPWRVHFKTVLGWVVLNSQRHGWAVLPSRKYTRVHWMEEWVGSWVGLGGLVWLFRYFGHVRNQ